MSYLSSLDSDRGQRQPGFHHARPTQSSLILQGVRRKLQDAATVQERLAGSREELLKERERLRASGGRVRNKRVEAGNAEATFMSALRNYLNYMNVDIPKPLLEAYGQVETLRNELGVLEEDFLEADRKFAGTEWRLLDQENDFFQFDLLELYDSAVEEHINEAEEGEMEQIVAESTIKPGVLSPAVSVSELPLSPSAIPGLGFSSAPFHSSPQYLASSSGTQDGSQYPGFLQPPRLTIHPAPLDSPSPLDAEDIQYRIVTAQLEGLKRDFNSLRQVQSSQVDVTDDDNIVMENKLLLEEPDWDEVPAISDFQSIYFGVLQQISDHEVAAQRLKTDVMLREARSQVSPRRRSDPTHLASTAPVPSLFIGKALSETAIPLVCNDPNTKERVREWLLVYLKENAVQKAIYHSILTSNGIESPVDETWEDRAMHFWDVDSASNLEPSTRATSHASQEPEADGSPFEIEQLIDEQSGLDPCGASVQSVEREVHEGTTSLQCQSVDQSALLNFSSFGDNMLKTETREHFALAEQPELSSPCDVLGHNTVQDVEPRIPSEVTDFGCENLGKIAEVNENDAEIVRPEIGVIEAKTSAPEVHYTLPSILDTAQDKKDLQAPFDTRIPTIVTTDVDMHHPNTLNERDEPLVQQADQSNEHDIQAPESPSCGSSWSRLVVLGVSTRPKSDYGGGEKSRRERLSDTWARLRHHRRTYSGSYLPESRDASYDRGRKRKD